MENIPSEKRGFFDGNPKMLFVFGLVTGIALTAIFYSTTWPINGDKTEKDNIEVIDVGQEEEQELILATPTAEDWIRGDIETAKVVLIEYSDFECPYCSKHQPTMIEIMDKYEGDVAWVYRHLPLSFHENALPSALASECAGEQGEFWAFADVMYENRENLGDDLYFDVADDLGLDLQQFETCYTTEKYISNIEADLDSAFAAGANGTPATFVNGMLVSGALPIDAFVDIIDGILAE